VICLQECREKEFIYTSNLNLDLRERITKAIAKTTGFTWKTQSEKNHRKERENSLFSYDYSKFHRG